MFKRFVERRVEEALSDTPVVLIVGPRRAGKTTLVRKMGEAGRTYITLDDQTVLEAAQSDPAGFHPWPGPGHHRRDPRVPDFASSRIRLGPTHLGCR